MLLFCGENSMCLPWFKLVLSQLSYVCIGTSSIVHSFQYLPTIPGPDWDTTEPQWTRQSPLLRGAYTWETPQRSKVCLSLDCATDEAGRSNLGSSLPNSRPFLKELGSFSRAFDCNVKFQIWGWEGYGLWMSILSLLLWGDSQGIEAAQSEPVPPARKAITWATSGKPCYLQVIPVLTQLSWHTR